MIKLTNNAEHSYKIGLDEIQDLKSTMLDLMKPVKSALKDKIYWSEVDLNEAEYKSRDGFIPHSHNCGGIQIHEVIPKCEEYDFGYLEFGECDTPDECQDECLCEAEGHLDAALKIFFKFEGYDPKTGELSFYLILHGGNDDAPYFRKSQDIYEAEFTARSLDDLRRQASKPIGDLIRLINAG